MIYEFHKTFNNMWHFTAESILTILDKLPEIDKVKDIIYIPDYKIYPHDLVLRILDGYNVQIVPGEAPLVYQGHYLARKDKEALIKMRKLCHQLLSYIPKKEVSKNSIYMTFRLHNRRWLPVNKIQHLIEALSNKGYSIILNLNPTCEGVTEYPDIKKALKVYNISYEEQLSYASSCDYGIFGNTASMICCRVAGIPSVMVTPCLITEKHILGEYYGKNIITVSNKYPDTSYWNADMPDITVDEVINAFEKVKNFPKI